MKTLILLSCCRTAQTTEWSPLINALPGICWGVISLAALYFILKYVAAPLIANCHERKLKAKAFENEQFWYQRSMAEKDFKKIFEDKISDLQNKNEELSKKLEQEVKDREDTLKKERIQAELNFYKNLVEALYPQKK